jgi:hypothetical protein
MAHILGPLGPVISWVGPHWVGPHRATASADDPILSAALASTFDALHKQRKPQPSSTVAPTWQAGPPTAQALALPAPVSGQDVLMRYDTELRCQLIAQDILDSLTLATTANQSVARSTGRVIYSLDKPSPNMRLAELGDVKQAAFQRKDQLLELLAQAGSAPRFLQAPIAMAADQQPFTFEVMQVIALVVTAAIHPIKHQFRIGRPVAMDAKLIPVIETPPHFSFPSGHATFSYAVAEFLPALLSGRSASNARDSLLGVAELIADNRVVAGVHFPMDSMAGEVMGRGLGAWLIGLGGGDPVNAQFPELAFTVSGNAAVREIKGTHTSAGSSPMWQWLVHRAFQEWA